MPERWNLIPIARSSCLRRSYLQEGGESGVYDSLGFVLTPSGDKPSKPYSCRFTSPHYNYRHAGSFLQGRNVTCCITKASLQPDRLRDTSRRTRGKHLHGKTTLYPTNPAKKGVATEILMRIEKDHGPSRLPRAYPSDRRTTPS
jgi:hypothetical protein